MGKTVTIGGERLGSGNKMTEEMHGYGSSVHDLSYVFKSSATTGTLMPFMLELMLNGDHATIDLETMIRTHPTVGAMFGSFKVQMDIFSCPIRYYNKLLHNNKKGIGMNMKSVYMPQIAMEVRNPNLEQPGLNQQQINAASLLHYMGISGIGKSSNKEETTVKRNFNAIPILAYWDIYANYYANLQEKIGVVVGQSEATQGLITGAAIENNNGTNRIPVTELLTTQETNISEFISGQRRLVINGQGLTPNNVMLQANMIKDGEAGGQDVQSIEQWATLMNNQSPQNTWNVTTSPIGVVIYFGSESTNSGLQIQITSTPTQAGITIAEQAVGVAEDIKIQTFDITTIDNMRDAILSAPSSSPFIINDTDEMPYKAVYGTFQDDEGNIHSNSEAPMAGLGIKTYQSDLLNNWLSTEWIEGTNSVTELSSIDVSDGTLTMDSLNLQQKIYNVLNRVILSGGSYRDWQEAVYAHKGTGELEIPEWIGGASSEIVFNEVISTSATEAENDTNPDGQALGTLGGRGQQVGIKKNLIKITAKEPLFLIGLISITPRLDYSQGIKWIYDIETMDDLHKPELDGIGFQDLITERMAAWDTTIETGTGNLIRKSAGKQPAWIEYTTNLNQVHGNFANLGTESFMVLNRQYEPDITGSIKDLTTYIDPTKFNGIFATKGLASQHFWIQIGVDLKMSRVMATTQIPQL